MPMPTTDISNAPSGFKRDPISAGMHPAIICEVLDMGEDVYDDQRHWKGALVIQVPGETYEYEGEVRSKEIRWFFNSHKWDKVGSKMDWRPVTGKRAKFCSLYKGVTGKEPGQGFFWYPMSVEKLKEDFEGKPCTILIEHDPTREKYIDRITGFGLAKDGVDGVPEGYTPVDERQRTTPATTPDPEPAADEDEVLF